MKFTIKIYKNDKLISKTRTGKKRLFLKKIRSINWKDRGIKVYLKVSYGKKFDKFGKYTEFWNDGDYTDKDSLLGDFYIFTEDD
jgi:hypothetical protein